VEGTKLISVCVTLVVLVLPVEYPTEYDPTAPIDSNENVSVNDKVIIFKDKYEGNDILATGDKVSVGDPIVIHTTNTTDKVTHGKSSIEVGDKIIIVPTQDDDLVALKAGADSYSDCNIIHHYTHPHYEQHDPPDGTWQYASFDIKL
jgi:hypothetical protein